jgi:hypothetical protein
MNITSAQYMAYQGNNTCIRIVVDGITMHVPLEVGNRHYAEIMRQVDAGELTIEDAD